MAELSPSFSPDFDTESPWFRRKLPLLAAIAALLTAAGVGYWYFFRDDTPAPVEAVQQTAEAANGQLVTSLTSNGSAAASLSSKLTFQTSARVAAVNVSIGDKVEAGQVLATLDSADAQRKLESATITLTAAQLRLSDLYESATASEVVSAQASVTTAQVQLANAEDALSSRKAGPDSDDVTAADSSVTQAQQGVSTAETQKQSAWISLVTAQRTYCSTDNHLVAVCYETDVPLAPGRVDALIAEIRRPATSTVGTVAQGLISANTAYENTLTSLANAQKSVETAKEKRKDLDAPPTALELQQLEAAVTSANAQLLAAEQKVVDLQKGPAATDVAQQQQSVRSAQDAVEAARTTLEATVLKAPFAGTITAVGVAAGDSATAATAAFTITNEDAIRVDLSVQEADFVGLKAGQYGTATFESLPGNTYAVRVTSVNPTPTTTQGVVSYQVQAEILHGSQLQDPANLQGITQALAAANGGAFQGAAGGGPVNREASPAAGGAGNEIPPAAQTARAGGVRPGGQGGFTGTPPAGLPTGGGPGAQGNQGSPGGAALGGAALQSMLNAPMPAPGMTASVTIVKTVEQDVLLVPTTALRTRGQQKYVIVKKDDGTTEDRIVQTGSSNSASTAIVSGLSAGESVVLGSTNAAAPATTGNNSPTTNQQGGPFAGPGGGFTGGAGGNTTGGTGGVR